MASKTVSVSVSTDSFWRSVNILLTKPHVVNKRLWGSKIIFRGICKPLSSESEMQYSSAKLDDTENIQENLLRYIKEQLRLQLSDENEDRNDKIEVIFTEFLPKNYNESHAFQLACFSKERNEVIFHDVTPVNYKQNLCPKYSYTLQLNSHGIQLQASREDSKSFQWLEDNVLNQFVKWMKDFEHKQLKQQLCTESLTLVSIEKYYKKYNELKLKYGKDMVKIWPECTDPSKFVYEDVAIATYLLLIWESERKQMQLNKPQTFVDLGCGNGLLVYILTKEGHSGVGIDVRRRQIWDLYPSDVKLDEKTITPSDSNLFPDTHWIIGNHSDELTPWIPVIAARSSYICKFFLLPCCAYNFDGTKYQRQNSSKSQYTEYLEYIKQMCEDCGFYVDIDRLKIPSTKRICLVSKGRSYSKEEYEEYCNRIKILLVKETVPVTECKNENNWIKNFRPRAQVERVRNCTQIDKNVVESIIHVVTKYLLEECNVNSTWSAGKIVDINELVKLIREKDLKALKSECGGLQTLLKNQHHIFKIQSGMVQLKYPKTIEDVLKGVVRKKKKAAPVKLQQKPCWFHNNHPQGCPLKDNICSFLHVTT